MVDYRDILGISSLSDEADSGSGIRVAVLDTGIPDVRPVSVDFCDNFTKDGPEDQGHATFIGSILFGNDVVIGLCNKATSCFGKVFERTTADPAVVAKAIRHAVDVWKVDVINLSLGFSSESACPSVLKEACEYAHAEGTVIVAAAGNDGGRVLWPAGLPTVICVGASEGVEKEPYSNYGAVDVVVPGTSVDGISLDGQASKRTGTSFSAAIITGLLTLLLAIRRKKNQSTSPDELKQLLIDMCIDIGVTGWDELTGYGFPFRPIIQSIAGSTGSDLLATRIFVKIKEITKKVIKALTRRITGDE